LIVSLVDWRNLRLTDDSQWRVTVPPSGADETRVDIRLRCAPTWARRCS